MSRILTVVDYPGLAGARLGQGVPTGAKCALPYPGATPDPSCACQATSDGHVVCSDGFVYSGGCPHCPPINMDGVAADLAPGIPKIPPPRGGAAPIPGGAIDAPASTNAAPGPSAGTTALVFGGVLAAGAAAFFFLK